MVEKNGRLKNEFGWRVKSTSLKYKRFLKAFLKELHKDEDLKDVVGAAYLYLFDNKGSSYCVAANYLVDGQGKVCLDFGSDMKMKKLSAKDKTMLNAYTLCLKALENKKCFQKKL